MIRFLAPWWLLCVAAVVVLAGVYVWAQLRRKKYAVRFSNVNLLRSIAPRVPGWRRHVIAGALAVGVLALSLGMARPAVDVEKPLERATVVLAIDVSLSMKATDVAPDRLKAAQNAAKLFVKQLPKSYNLSLVSFAKTANVLVPATKDRAQVNSGIDHLKLAESTAIGEAIFASLQSIANVPADGAKNAAPARIVLLSDGFTTSGRSNDEATQAALAAKVRLDDRLRYTQRLGRGGGNAGAGSGGWRCVAQDRQPDQRQVLHRGDGRPTEKCLQRPRVVRG